MNIDIKITIEEPENSALAASKELAGAYLDGLTGWAKAKHDEKNSPEAEAADRKEHTPFLVGWPDTPTTPTSSERELADKEALDSHRQAQRVYELTVSRDAIAQQMVKAENEANNLRDDNADLADENQELNQRVEALVAELAESELHAARLEKHNLALQSANTALRARTLKTRTGIPEVGETVDVIPDAVVKALPIGARFKDREGNVVWKWAARGMAWSSGSSLRHEYLSDGGPFTRIDNVPDEAATDA